MEKIEQKSARYVRRLAPCQPYDVEGMESWLTDMEARGFRLCEDGFTCLDRGIFQVVPPGVARYRLQPAENTKYFRESGDPPKEGQAMLRDMGWDYVARWHRFAVYRCGDPSAPELNTDPRIQAIAFDAVCWQELRMAIGAVSWIGILSFVARAVGPLQLLLELGTWYVLLILILSAWGCGSLLISFLSLDRLQRKLRAGTPLEHRRDWRWQLRRKYVRLPLLFLLVAAIAGMWLYRTVQNKFGVGCIERSAYAEEVPFPISTDLAQGVVPGSYEAANLFATYNKVRETSNPLIPYTLELRELGWMTTEEGERPLLSLDASYHEADSPGLARELDREYFQQASQHRSYTPPSPLEDLGVESAWTYSTSGGFATVVLRQDCRVLKMTFHQSDGDARTTAEWAALLAETILEEEGL